jgi:hypothetical protein
MAKRNDAQKKARKQTLTTIEELIYQTTPKLTRIVTQKITKKVELEEQQQGFRSGRSCTDAVFINKAIKGIVIWITSPKNDILRV